MNNEPARVFISYSHDSARHKLQVLELANTLRKDGVNASLDRYVSFPAEGWQRWMVREITEADVVLVICTEIYQKRFDGTASTQKGAGARWEGLILTQALYEDMSRNQGRIIPVFFDNADRNAIPVSLRPFSHFRLPNDYEALFRVLTNQPDVEVPSVGNLKILPPTHVDRENLLPVVSAGADRDIQEDDLVNVAPQTNSKTINDQCIEALREKWHVHRLTLIVGPGFSSALGIPSWSMLLNQLLASYVQQTYAGSLDSETLENVHETLANGFGNISSIHAAEFIEARMPPSVFTEVLKTSLYRQYRASQHSEEWLDAIVSLHGGLHSIVSLNYDDVLEEALSKREVEFTTVAEGRDFTRIRGLPVYHPYGYLPRKGRGSSAVIFTKSQYHSHHPEGFNWANLVIQRLLMESTCLFIGTSLSDPEFRGMTRVAYSQNSSQRQYFLIRSPHNSDRLLREATREILEASYEEIGVVPVWMDSYAEMPQLLRCITTSKPIPPSRDPKAFAKRAR